MRKCALGASSDQCRYIFRTLYCGIFASFTSFASFITSLTASLKKLCFPLRLLDRSQQRMDEFLMILMKNPVHFGTNANPGADSGI